MIRCISFLNQATMKYTATLGVFISFPTLLFSLFAYSQAPIQTFEKTYGGSNLDEGHFFSVTSDGGYIITGLSESFGDSLGNTYLIKTNSNGEEQWHTISGGDELDGGNSVFQTADGGYFITNHTESYGAGDCDSYIFKTDENGNMVWSNTYGDIYDDAGYEGIQTIDGGYAVTGLTVTDDDMQGNTFLAKYTAAGETEWVKTFGDSGIDLSERMLQTPDGGFLLAGMTTFPSNGPEDIAVIKTDAAGNLQWSKHFGGDGYEEAYGLAATADGGYVISGFSTSFSTNNDDAYLVKINSDGNLAWSRAYGGTRQDRAYAVAQANDGGFILTGTTASFGDTLSDLLMLKTDVFGNQLWMKSFGGTKKDEGRWVITCADGGYAAIGTTESSGNGNADFYFVKTDDAGNVSATADPAAANSSIDIFPNPFKSSFTIHQSGKQEKINFSLYDVTGKLVEELLNISSAETEIAPCHLTGGIYFYKIFNDEHLLLSAGKLVAE